MYNGELITFTFKDNPVAKALSLTEINVDIDESGIKITKKSDNKFLGYLINICGIDLIEFMKLFNFEYQDETEQSV